jgi:hypothetical protein
MAVQGATAADACRLFANPVSETIMPAAIARATQPEGRPTS